MRFCSLLLSQLLTIVFVFAMISIGFFLSSSQDTSVIQSSSREWKDEKNPAYMAHLTDVHVDSNLEWTQALYDLALNVSASYKPNHLFITGDLVNNWGTNNETEYGNQYEPDFKLYSKLTEPHLASFPLFADQSGNHDQFGVRSFNSSKHFFKKYSISTRNNTNLSISDFYASTYYNDGRAFVVLNPIIYPFPHAMIDLWTHPTTELLDLVETQLKSIQGASETFVLTHFPVTFWTEEYQSTSGKSFRQMISEYNVTMAITGHLHPKHTTTFHHGTHLEILASDLTTHHSMGIITVDNGNTVYHTINVDTPQKVFITSPVPTSQLTSLCVFNNQSLSIRAISFLSNNASITVSGDASGKLSYVRDIKDGASLYELNCSLSTGKHQITLSGDDNETIEFFIGDSLGSRKEKSYGYEHFTTTAIILLVVGFSVALYITCPVFCNGTSLSNSIDSFEDVFLNWVEGESSSLVDGPTAKQVTYFILGGPVYLRWTFLILPLWMRILIFILIWAPLFIPISFFWIEDAFCAMFVYGYIAEGKIFPEIWGCIVTVVYISCAVFPAIFALTGMVATGKKKWPAIFYFAFQLIGYALCFCMIDLKLLQAVGPLLANLSPLLVFVPLVLIGCSIGFFLTKSEDIGRSVSNAALIGSKGNEI